MKFRHHRALALASLLAIPCFTLGVNGCMTDEKGTDAPVDTTKHIDPFPRPQGPRIIPLDQESFSGFHYVEFDMSGQVLERIPNLVLYISRRKSGYYSYAFQTPTRGYLMRYLETANLDSAGVYIVGTFQDSVDILDAVPVLWLPQNPKRGVSWPIGSGRAMALDDSSETYFTETLFPYDTVGAPVAQGFQRHTAYRFRETAGDTVTLYHFRKGVGCLGFERSVQGTVIASGTIQSFYRMSGR